MIREQLNEILQSKNAVMFITSMLFMTGILAYFNDTGILSACILTIISVFLLLRNRLPLKYILFWIFIFYLGYINANVRTGDADMLYLLAPRDGKIEGQIVTIPNKTNNTTRFFMNVESINGQDVNSKTFVTLVEDGDYSVGDYVTIEGRVRRPFIAGNPSQFDYGKYLRNFDAYTTTFATRAEIKDIELSPKWKFLRSLNDVRNSIIETHSHYLKSPNLEILGGIVFGDDAVAPPDYIKSTFVNSGLLHILAASGMNVAFIFGFWFFIMRFFRIPYKLNIAGGIVMVILYTLMTGLGASVLRAALMLLFIQIGKLIDRDAHSVSLLSFVAFLLLIYNPAYINDVGFQLSFIVTFGLLTTGKVLFDKMQNWKAPEWIKGGILIPIIAQFWVAPIQMFYFNTISTYSILANIATVPFLSVISFGGFVSSILATIRPIADFVCMVFDFILKYMLDCVVIISNFFSQLPHSLFQTTHPSVMQILMYYTILLLITLLIKIGINKKLLITICASCVLLMLSTISIPNQNFELIAFDVQSADAFLLKTPQNKYFIIDTARQSYRSQNSTARLVITKYLKDRGIKNIEGMILTHFDLDHAGGAVDLMNDLNIKKVYINSTNKKNYTIHKIFDTMQEKKIPYELAKNNNLIYEENNFKIRTYQKDEPDNDNESSIITLVSYKDFDTLFMGDAGIIGFNKIKKDVPNNIEVLKVGHHGGTNVVNKEMLKHLGNDVSIISVGPNRFGHPTKATLKILDNTEIYRTDTNHSIKVTSNGKTFKVYTFNSTFKKYELSDEIATH